MEDFERVEPRIDKVLTQYRESPKLLHLIRTYLRQVEMVQQAIYTLPDYFDIDTAVGDQLTLIGKRMGFPRDHCVCDVQPVFGFDCPDGNDFNQPVLGFCSGVTWESCVDFGISTVFIDDDEIYRRFLKVRRFQMLALFDRASLTQALKIFWGDAAKIMDAGRGRVIVTPGRDLTDVELGLIQVYPRLMPIGLGIALRFHFGSIRAFGFGEGWGGFCEGEGGEGTILLTENDQPIETEEDVPIETDSLGIGADWMCEIDVRPYDC
ncbi:DUF2612 domain-containing protein [Aurantimonas sp. A2-1-M11]|uniref:DUF2612 domain-containing protein n=1 Tax=Aurantimonas sp. A2-1-M11 TaxID=3113712 RepID=UPI002F9300A3